MKIRIKDNSIRMRLTRSEVDAMRDQGEVVGCTDFPGGQRFSYAVRSVPGQEAGASFDKDEICVSLPATLVSDWADSEQVSISDEQPLGDGETLFVLVEKDFACLAPRPGEDESDMFAHPDAGKVQC